MILRKELYEPQKMEKVAKKFNVKKFNIYKCSQKKIMAVVIKFMEAWWPHGQCAQLRIKRSRFEL